MSAPRSPRHAAASAARALATVLGALALAVALAACGGDDDAPSGGAPPAATASAEGTARATPSASTGTPAQAAPPASVDAKPIALRALSERVWTRPTEVGPYPLAAGDTTLFVAEQDGTLWTMRGNEAAMILDLRDRISRAGNEEGLLSVALDPGFASNRHVWIYYAAANPRRTVLARFTRAADGPRIDPASQLVALEVAQPFSNHKGGAIRFGRDGMLYLGLGDGGSQGDPSGNGQNLGALLGKMLRIDVRNASAGQPYVVPSDNPFVGRAGARGEIWAYGFRNPWRSVFDAATGALWNVDVGQGEAEEVDVVERGANYGWSIVEGDNCYKPSSNCPRDGLTAPVTSYDHSGGRCSVSGTVVYRGTAVPEIAGNVIYGDLCSGELWGVRADRQGQAVRIATGVRQVTSFGVDAAGEVLVVAFGQPIRQIVRP